MGELSFDGITILQSFMLALSATAVVTRVAIRLVYLSSKLHASDYFVIAGWICCFGWVLSTILALKFGYTVLVDDDQDADLDVKTKKALFIANFFIDIGFYGPKASLLCFYYTLFQKEHRRERIALHATTVFVVCACIATTLSDIFTCHNVSDNWSADPDACSTWYSLSSFTINYSLNVSTDILVFCLPLSIIRRLKVDRKVKFGLAGTFLLGFLTITISAFRFIWCTIEAVYPPITIILCTAEFTTALIVVCIPILRTVYTRRKKKLENNNNVAPNNYLIIDAPQQDVEKGSGSADSNSSSDTMLKTASSAVQEIYRASSY